MAANRSTGRATCSNAAAYIYQGQEPGLPEVDVPVEARVDPMWARGGVCRDGARVPLPWTTDAALQPNNAAWVLRD